MFLKGKVAIVTGSGRGIGKSIALELAKQGCKVVVTSRTKKEIDETVKEISYDALGIISDVSDYNSVKKIVGETIKKFGKIDILVNNAGLAVRKHFSQTEKEEWDKMVDVNLKGAFNFTKEVLPIMLIQKSGWIINISSGAGKTGIPGLSVYSATKFGLIGFTEALAQEVENDGVKVYCVCPGSTDTKMYRDLFPGSEAVSKPEDIAEVVLKLCKPDCKTENGSIVNVF